MRQEMILEQAAREFVMGLAGGDRDQWDQGCGEVGYGLGVG